MSLRLDYTRLLYAQVIIVAMLFYVHLNVFIAMGMFLLIEHALVWQTWVFWEMLTGHEWLGIYLVSAGLIIEGQAIFILVLMAAFLLGCNFKYQNPLKLKRLKR